MTRYNHLVATAILATLTIGPLALAWADDPPVPPRVPKAIVYPQANEYPPNATDAQKLEIDLRGIHGKVDDATRKKLMAVYPFESLAERLKFDIPGRARITKTFPTANLDLDKWQPQFHTAERSKIPPVSLAVLMTEQQIGREQHFERSQALAALHQVEVRKFVTNPGFGMSRMVQMPRYFMQYTETPPKDWSEADRGEPVTLPKTGDFFNPSKDKKGPTLPSVLALSSFHASTTLEFSRPDSWGLVKDKKQVAGFQPHTLEFIPDAHARSRYDMKNPIKDKTGKAVSLPLVERWAVRKVELIGLLMHDSPVVYLTPDGKLPTMDAAKDANTRELSKFESDGLKDLAAGKEVVTVDATTNQVRMVGAIRMANACLKCHEGKRGDLLGAFTYDLVRDPAFIPEQK